MNLPWQNFHLLKRMQLEEEDDDDVEEVENVEEEDEYPDTCPQCGRRAYLNFTQYKCTNRSCKYFDRKRLGK
jgi:hypothetical protein